MKFICAAFNADIDHICSSAIFSRKAGTLHFELLQRINIRLNECSATLHFSDECTVERPSGLIWRAAINVDGHSVGTDGAATSARALPAWCISYPRSETSKLPEASSVQWNVFD